MRIANAVVVFSLLCGISACSNDEPTTQVVADPVTPPPAAGTLAPPAMQPPVTPPMMEGPTTMPPATDPVEETPVTDPPEETPTETMPPAEEMMPVETTGVPRIPEPLEDCPDFNDSSATIRGLRTMIQAGTPGDSKGALLFAWHFTAGTAGAAMSGVPTSVRSEITAGGGIVVAPQGNQGGGGRTDIAPPTGAWFIEDLEFADQVVACAVKNHNIDPNRIYATGCSAGGLMSGTFGLMRSEYVAAVAPNSGGINFQNSRKLSDTSHGPAAFLMHGGAGDNVIVNFGDTSEWFQAQNRMATNNPFMFNCNHGRGHCGTPTSLHELAWEFMKAHPYDVGESPWASAPPSELPSYCEVVP